MRTSLVLFALSSMLAGGCAARLPTEGLEKEMTVCDICTSPGIALIKGTVTSWESTTKDIELPDGLLETTQVEFEVTEVLRGDIAPGKLTLRVKGRIDRDGNAVCGSLESAKAKAVYVAPTLVEGHWLVGLQTMFVPADGGLTNQAAYARRPLPESNLRAAGTHDSRDACIAAGLDAIDD